MTTLLVAATGGHLAQLYQLRPRLVPDGDRVVWATFDAPQSRSMLAGEDVVYVPYVAPRDYAGVARNAVRARHVLREHRVDRVFSTGSGIALSFLPLARLQGIPTHYIESAARSQGPSVTGRLLALVPGIRVSSQYASWAGGRWELNVSVFDDFRSATALETAPELRRVVVTLGTIEGYGFRRLLERLLEVLPADAEVLWQTGVTDVQGLPLEARPSLPQHELHQAMAEADVVVAHAGIGSALGALNAGRCPVLVPRRASRGEHVDDHQVQIARELASRGLAVHLEVDGVTAAALTAAAGGRVAAPGRA